MKCTYNTDVFLYILENYVLYQAWVRVKVRFIESENINHFSSNIVEIRPHMIDRLIQSMHVYNV